MKREICRDKGVVDTLLEAEADILGIRNPRYRFTTLGCHASRPENCVALC